MALKWKRSSFEPEASDVFRAAAARRREAVRGLLCSALKLGVGGGMGLPERRRAELGRESAQSLSGFLRAALQLLRATLSRGMGSFRQEGPWSW